MKVLVPSFSVINYNTPFIPLSHLLRTFCYMNSPLWKRVIAWVESSCPSDCGKVWGDVGYYHRIQRPPKQSHNPLVSYSRPRPSLFSKVGYFFRVQCNFILYKYTHTFFFKFSLYFNFIFVYIFVFFFVFRDGPECSMFIDGN